MNDRSSSKTRVAACALALASHVMACREAPTDARVEAPPVHSTDVTIAPPPAPPAPPAPSAPAAAAPASAAGGSTCAADSDCVPAACCHAAACVPRAQAPQGCRGMMCSMNCVPGTVDCGGRCACQAGSCVVKPATATGPAPQ